MQRTKRFGIEPNSDWIGIISSVGCMVHCLAVPLILYFSGAVLEQSHYVWVDYLFVLVAGLAVLFSVRQSRSLPVKFLLILAWLLFALSVVLQPVFPPAYWFMYVGSAALVAGHTLNLRHCRQCKVHKHRITA